MLVLLLTIAGIFQLGMHWMKDLLSIYRGHPWNCISSTSNMLFIAIKDPGVFAGDLSAVVCKRDEARLLEYRHSSSGPGCTMNPRSTIIVSNHTATTNALGATKTSFDLCGYGNRWCLLVSEWKTE